MANTIITNIKTSLNAAVLSTAILATSDTIDLAEIFDITPTKSKTIIIINNTAAAAGTVTFSIAAGNQFGSAGAALTGTVAQATSKVLELDTAKYMGDGGVITLTITPTSGAKLKTGNIVTIQVIELV